MRKWLAIAVQIPFVAMMFAACSSDDSGNPDASDASKDVAIEKKPLPETGPIDSGGGCAPSPVTPSDVTWTPPHPINPTGCSDVQIQGYYAACLNGGTTCNTWTPANQSCYNCIVSTEHKDTSFGPIIDTGGGVVYANTGGCIALETNDVTDTGCGAKEWETSECEDLACSPTCPITDTASFTAYQNCTTAAASGTCSAFASAQCNLADAGSVAACNLNAQSFQALYVSIATVFCGGYPADAGVPDGGSDASTDASSDGSSDAALDADGD